MSADLDRIPVTSKHRKPLLVPAVSCSIAGACATENESLRDKRGHDAKAGGSTLPKSCLVARAAKQSEPFRGRLTLH